MTECGAALRAIGAAATEMPDAMQQMVGYLFSHLCSDVSAGEQCVLVRGFVSRPYGDLSEAERECVELALGRAPYSPSAKCLTLLGSAGLEPEWNDRTHSRRYRAIPLTSEHLVSQCPMFSELLKQLGVTLQSTEEPDTDLLREWEQQIHNVFFVPDALGSSYVPVQEDFVRQYGVRSVLGFGGVLPSGHLFVVILFTRVPIPADTVGHFRTLAPSVMLALLPHDQRADPPTRSVAALDGSRAPQGSSSDALWRLRAKVRAMSELLAMHEQTVIADVIQRDVTEARVERLRRDYELLLTSARDGIYGVDQFGMTSFLNPAAAEMLGWSAEELIGRPMHMVIHYSKADRSPYPSEACPILDTLQDGIVHMSVDEVFWRRDGSSFHVEYSATSIHDQGRIVGAVVMFRDITERRRAERALRKTQQQFGLFMDHLPGFAWIKDAQGRHLYANRQFSQMLIRDVVREGKIGQELGPTDLANYDLAHDREALETGPPQQQVESYVLDGQVAHALVSRFVINQEEGEPLLLGGVAIDITEKTRAEHALRESEERYRQLVQISPDCIFIQRGGRIVFINQQGVALFGASQADEILGKSPFDLVHPDCHARVGARIRALELWGGTAEREEQRYVRLDGTTIDVEVTATQFMDRSEPAIQVVARDITERKRAEAALRQAQARYQNIFEQAVEGIFQTTAAGRFLVANPALAAMCGYDSPDELMQAVTDVGAQLYVDPRERDKFRAAIERQGVVCGFEYQLYRKDRSRFWVSEYARVARDDRGDPVCYEGMLMDITQRREAQIRLEETLERVRTLSRRLEEVREEERARIARELHDELGVGLTCLKIDLARAAAWMTSEMTEARREAVSKTIQSMMGQTDATIDAIQRIVAELRPGVLDDLGLVASIEWQCRDFERRIGVPCGFRANGEDIDIDPDRATAVFRICQEALTNVARHAGATVVSVRLEEVGDRVILEVLDNGCGIPPEKVSDATAFGLIGMQERAKAFEGRLCVRGQPDRGTRVSLDIGAHA